MKFIALLMLMFSGCTNLFFYPDRDIRLTPDEIGLSYTAHDIPSADGLLKSWRLRSSEEVKGTILHFHGNAENISTHIGSVYWLPGKGYEVLSVDYRGYGESTGRASLLNAIEDVRATLDWALDSVEVRKPVFVLAQSIGGALAIRVLADYERKQEFGGVVIESAFSSYRQIAKEKLAALWLTTLLRWPLSLLISDSESPTRYVGDISPVPLLFIHGDLDQVVPVHHSEELYRLAGEPKELWRIPKGHHISAFSEEEQRKRLLERLSVWVSGE